MESYLCTGLFSAIREATCSVVSTYQGMLHCIMLKIYHNIDIADSM